MLSMTASTTLSKRPTTFCQSPSWHLGETQERDEHLLEQRVPPLSTLHKNELRHAATIDDEAANNDFDGFGFLVAAVRSLLVLEDGLADSEEDEREEESRLCVEEASSSQA